MVSASFYVVPGASVANPKDSTYLCTPQTATA